MLIKGKRYIFLLSFVFLTLSSSQLTAQLSKAEYDKDIDYLTEKLTKYYAGLYYYESPTEFNQRLTHLKGLVKDSVTVHEAYKNIALFVSDIKDLHLGIGLPKNFFVKDTKVFPFFIRRFGNDFFVHYNQSNDSTIVRGSKILAINKTPVLQDFDRFKTLYGADFGNIYSKNYYAEYNFQSFYNRWYSKQDSALITYQIQKDTIIKEEKIDFLLAKDATKNLTKRYKNVLRKNLTVEIIDSTSHTAKLDITSFRTGKGLFNFNEKKFRKNLKKCFKQIEKDSTQNLVLDLRGNGGGAVVNVHRLLSYVSLEPFRLYDTVFINKAGFKKLIKPQYGITYVFGRLFFSKKDDNGYFRSYTDNKKLYRPVKKHHFGKNLYVVMDGGSYSATTFTIALLKNMNRATFVGTPPGGANWGSFAGQSLGVKLPESKIRVTIPLMKLVHSTANLNHSDFVIQPDYFVKQSFEDFLQRKDTPIVFIKKLHERN